ncbi:MAG: FecR family protein [Pseudomonadota bacterium]
MSDEAIDWLVRLRSGAASSLEERDFLRWRRQSAAHEAAAAEAEALMGAVGQTRQAREFAETARQSVAAPRRRLPRRALFAVAAAASVAAIAVNLPALGPLAGLYSDHATAVGQRKRAVLPDGSMVDLNTATALSLEYSSGERRLVLYEGEIFVDVAKDPARPFVVVSGPFRAQAVGTAFGVRRRDGGGEVSVTEGTVEVRIGERPAMRVQAGQHLEIGNEGRFRLAAIDVDTATAWQRGKLIVNRWPLQAVVAELERYRTGRIVIMNEQLKSFEITGVFDVDDPERVLRSIAETTHARLLQMPLLTVIR